MKNHYRVFELKTEQADGEEYSFLVPADLEKFPGTCHGKHTDNEPCGEYANEGEIITDIQDYNQANPKDKIKGDFVFLNVKTF